ncbi:MAG: hypothetical protein JO146_01350, partial [Candidatus Eremiobacteraeota bacterium]|nr:hypothetical protein [Candidatus Eremiobacteraeota bacterium]
MMVRCLLGALAAALLTACGGATPSAAGVPPNAHEIELTNAMGFAPVQHVPRRHSWIRPDADRQWLLYVSDASSGTIDIYNYRVKTGKLYGQITGLSFPYGQCTDASGDVYIVDNTTAEIYEYAHGGVTPIDTAVDDYGYPIGCSVDPKTGNVAVANFNSSGSGTGGIVVFTGGLRGSQSNYTDPRLFHFWPPGYDPKGNLFVQATDYSGANYFAELPVKQSKFTLLSGPNVGFPGSVAWDGSYIAVTDQNYQYGYTTMIYRVTVSGSAVTVVRETHLTDDCYPNYDWMVAVQPFVTGTARPGNAVVAGNLNCPSEEDFFNYTNGGNPKRRLPSSIAPA